jgi:hypothetical protein
MLSTFLVVMRREKEELDDDWANVCPPVNEGCDVGRAETLDVGEVCGAPTGTPTR